MRDVVTMSVLVGLALGCGGSGDPKKPPYLLLKSPLCAATNVAQDTSLVVELVEWLVPTPNNRAMVEGHVFVRCGAKMMGTSVVAGRGRGADGGSLFELKPEELLPLEAECTTVWDQPYENRTGIFLVGGRPRVVSASADWHVDPGDAADVEIMFSEKLVVSSLEGAVAVFDEAGSPMKPAVVKAYESAVHLVFKRASDPMPDSVRVMATPVAPDGRVLEGVTWGGHGDGTSIVIRRTDAQVKEPLTWLWWACISRIDKPSGA